MTLSMIGIGSSQLQSSRLPKRYRSIKIETGGRLQGAHYPCLSTQSERCLRRTDWHSHRLGTNYTWFVYHSSVQRE